MRSGDALDGISANRLETQKLMKFKDTYFSRDGRYSIGVEPTSGRYYASIPVSNGIVDYEEYYELTLDQYDEFLRDSTAAIAFIEACRRREHDDSLLQRPGGSIRVRILDSAGRARAIEELREIGGVLR
jgi:hypothetical protein